MYWVMRRFIYRLSWICSPWGQGRDSRAEYWISYHKYKYRVPPFQAVASRPEPRPPFSSSQAKPKTYSWQHRHEILLSPLTGPNHIVKHPSPTKWLLDRQLPYSDSLTSILMSNRSCKCRLVAGPWAGARFKHVGTWGRGHLSRRGE